MVIGAFAALIIAPYGVNVGGNLINSIAEKKYDAESKKPSQ
jgi:hypothetical protein